MKKKLRKTPSRMLIRLPKQKTKANRSQQTLREKAKAQDARAAKAGQE